MPSWRQKFRDFHRDITSESRLAETVQRLVADGELTPEAATRLTVSLRETRHESQYIIGQLCAHLAIGLIFSFDLVPLPLGTISRGAWVAGNRIIATVRGRPDQAKIHSWTVLFVSLIPFVGYFAYLIPLRATNADAAYLYANHVSYLRSDCALRQFVLQRPVWQRRLMQRLLSPILAHSSAPEI